MPKKKAGGGKKKPNNNTKTTPRADDDDWEALLAAESSIQQEPKKEEDKKALVAVATTETSDDKDGDDAGEDAAQAFLAAQGLLPVEPKAKKKKKKKKAATTTDAASKDVEKAPAKEKKLSGRGALVAERLRKQREEEERIAKLQADEDARIAEIERKEEEELRLKEEEKALKKQRQKEKIERQKKEGTYMTKKQKEKARLAEARLEAMKAAGIEVPTGGGDERKKVVYDTRKKKNNKKAVQTKPPTPPPPPEPVKEPEPEPEPTKPPTPPPKEEEEKDDWENSSSEGAAWDEMSDGSDQFDSLESKLAQIAINNDDEDEDLIMKEKAAEQERLRLLGLEQKRREAEHEAKLAALAEAEEEATLKERLAQQKREEGRKKRLKLEQENLAACKRDDLRCPIVVIMGHVDTGKTSLLDKIRKTNVQEGEAGGITQQIGATYFEKSTLEAQTNKIPDSKIDVPGMLVIDTPGHESFTNLRSRGSNLCDVAVLVVDLMHGLEPQTIESLNMLVQKKVPFVVALNKVDRCYSWKTCTDTPIRDALAMQEESTVQEFRTRAMQAKTELQEQGVNSNIYWEMGDENWENSDFVPCVPTSAITGEGIQDLLHLLCEISTRRLWKQLMWCANLQCTVLELKTIEGLGMTVDVLLVNGYLREGDKAVFCTLNGPVITEIRGLLTPPPSRESRVKSEYIHHKVVKGALGVKIIGNGLEKVMAGTPVMICGPDDEEEDIKAEVMTDLTELTSKLSTDKKGVMVHASTLGALEALLQFLREETKPPIPISSIGIGSVHKRDITKISVMNEKGCPEYATILAFDVEIEREAREYATEMKVRIFTADIIYHLFDQFTRFLDDWMEQRRKDAAAVAVFPCILKILPQHVFNQKDPIILGVEVFDGILKLGTPLCAPAVGGLHIGKVESIECNGKQQDTARKGASVAIKISNESNPNLTYGRQFDATHSLYSTLTRASIDALKANFKDKLDMEEWKLVVKLKKVFNII